jgi:hypothetical protein
MAQHALLMHAGNDRHHLLVLLVVVHQIRACRSGGTILALVALMMAACDFGGVNKPKLMLLMLATHPTHWLIVPWVCFCLCRQHAAHANFTIVTRAFVFCACRGCWSSACRQMPTRVALRFYIRLFESPNHIQTHLTQCLMSCWLSCMHLSQLCSDIIDKCCMLFVTVVNRCNLHLFIELFQESWHPLDTRRIILASTKLRTTSIATAMCKSHSKCSTQPCRPYAAHQIRWGAVMSLASSIRSSNVQNFSYIAFKPAVYNKQSLA